MKTLMINDLSRTDELDRNAMVAVRGGGSSMSAPSYSFMPKQYTQTPQHMPQYGSYDSSIHATQELMQYQNVVNATANGSAFLDGIHATNHTTQFGQNNIMVGN
jgi:hypothetical protein